MDQTTNANYGTPPSFVTNGLNGLPVVHFTNQTLSFTNFLTTNVETSVEGFALIRAVSTNSGAGLWYFGIQGSSALAYPSSTGFIVDDFGSTHLPASLINFAAPSVIANYHIYNVSSASNNWVARINGMTEYSNTTNTVGFPSGGNTPTLGATGNGYGPSFKGDMVEIMIFDRVLTTSERTTVQNYLNGKYGL